MSVIYYIEINIICIIILSLVGYQVFKKTKQKSTYNIVFNWLIFFAIIMCICDMIAGIFRGKLFTGARAIITISNWLYFQMLVVISFLWTIYVLLKTNEKVFHQKTKYLIVAPLVIYTLVALTNSVTGFLFTIDVVNLYVRGVGVIFHWIITWGYFLVSTLVTIIAYCKEKNKLHKQEIRPLIYFFIAPLIAAVIQMLFYGVSSTQVGVTVAIVMIYITLQNANVFTDTLTGLNNRRAFDNYIDRYLARRGDMPLIVMMIDVNNFKSINDHYGHVYGDYVLTEISNVLKQVCHEVSNHMFLCRFGGDEFLIADIARSEDDIQIIRDTINQALDDLNAKEKMACPVSVCIGATINVCNSTNEVQNLINLADKLMYEEKLQNASKGSC